MAADRTDVPDELRELIRRADRTRAARARGIVDHCIDELPHYRDLPESIVADVGRSVRRHLALFYRVTLQAGRPLSDEDLEPSRDTARQRAALGVPLGEFLMFFHVGLRVAWEDLIARVGDDPRLRAGLLQRVAAVITNQQLLMTALTESYVRESERLSRFREHDVDDFFRLLFAEDTVPNVIEARASALGVELSASSCLAIFAPPAVPSASGAGVVPDDVRRALLALDPGEEIWVGRCREGFGALFNEPPGSKRLAAVARRLFGRDGHVGVGEPAAEGGVRRSARQALRALRIGSSLRSALRVHRYAELAVADLVDADSEAAGALVESVLGPLLRAEGHRTRLDTLRQLAHHGFRLKLAAAGLGVHPHTLSYRVKQMRRRFALDLDDPETRLRLQLALLILDAQGRAG